MTPFRRDPSVEERVHVRSQILDHRQVAQRRNLYRASLEDLADMRPARPAGNAVHHHGARAAHAHAAGEAIGQRRIGILLDPRDDVQHRLVLMRGHIEALHSRQLVRPTALHGDCHAVSL
jgi:hypothetical protein